MNVDDELRVLKECKLKELKTFLYGDVTWRHYETNNISYKKFSIIYHGNFVQIHILYNGLLIYICHPGDEYYGLIREKFKKIEYKNSLSILKDETILTRFIVKIKTIIGIK